MFFGVHSVSYHMRLCAGGLLLFMGMANAFAKESSVAENALEAVHVASSMVSSNSSVKRASSSHFDDLKSVFPVLTPAQLEMFAQRLFQNECGGKRQHLVYWSPHESFPSLGIAHFIWLPKSQQNQPYLQTFPQLYRTLTQNPSLQPPPKWLTTLTPFVPPWEKRAQFIEAQRHPQGQQKLSSLRNWLWQTRRAQVVFVVQHFQKRLSQALKRLPPAQSALILPKLSALFTSLEGVYAALDYSSFKGIGLNPKERYQGEGWGLIEVLQAMPEQKTLRSRFEKASKNASVQAFIMAAKQVLQRRVENAPKPEQQWLTGWFKRIERYTPPAESQAI